MCRTQNQACIRGFGPKKAIFRAPRTPGQAPKWPILGPILGPKSAVRSIKPVPGRAQNRVKIPHFGPKISRTLHQTGPGEGPFWALPRPLFGQKSSLYQGKCSNLDPYFGPSIDKLAQNRPISRPHSEAIFTYTVVQTGQIQAPKWAQNRGVFVYTPKSRGRPALGRPRPI